MPMSTITFRVNDDLKKQAEEIFENIGINTTTAFIIFMKSVIREGKIPFELRVDPFWSKENQNRLKKALKNLQEGKGQEHDIIEVEYD